ncbi:MAG: hypothetical protein V4760_07255 [Bdellovibrionota bacterium]
MRKLKARTLALPAFLLMITTSFQNCDGGFVMDKNTGHLSSTSTVGLSTGNTIPATVQTTGPYGLKTYEPGGGMVGDAAIIDTAMDYTLMASGQGVTSSILTWSIPTGQNTASCQLGSTGSNYSKVLRCLTAGAVQVRAEAIWSDGTNSVAFINRTVQVGSVNPGGGTGDPNIIEFRIRTGTGTGVWNTVGTPAVAFVGQTLKVINDDTIQHQMHTNGTPCPHQPNPMAPNAFYNCVLAAAHSPTATDLYDHIVGTSASFYLNVIDGAAQYARPVNNQSCAGCHNAIATTTKRGATFTTIKAAINNNTGGMGIYRNNVMTDDEIRAIAYRLR